LAGDIEALIADIRLRTPLQALAQRTGWSLTLRSFHDCSRADLAAADVLIVQRGASRRAWRLQRAMRLRGGAVVSEIDDLLTAVPPHISNHRALQAQQPWVRRCLEEADAVTVSTARLGHELGLPQACVVPNCALPLGSVPLPAHEAAQPVSLLFASMERFATDFIYPALRALQGPGVRVVVVGPPGEAFAAAGVDVQRAALMPREDFIAFARSLPNPVAVIPLEDSRFAACKSALKWFEYAEAGIPVLCSAVSPYREVVQDGVTGALVPNDEKTWHAALQKAIVDSNWRHAVASAARATVRRDHNLAQTVDAWQQAVEVAVRQRSAAGRLQPGFGWRLQDGGAGLFEAAALRLRQLNRGRLARRQASKQAPAKPAVKPTEKR
jgi:hypothetical protein